METVIQDVRYGLRMLRKSPGFAAMSIVTLALGIGANTAIFSVVNGILLEPLPYSKPDQLVSVTGTYPRGAFVAMRQQVHTLDVATYAEGHELNLTGSEDPVRLTSTMVSAELFSVLGARPKLGRTFNPGDDNAGQDNYVLLSHALWEQRFGSDPSVIGRSIQLDGVGRQVIGVMPAEFHFPSPKTQIWIPLHIDARNVVAYWAGDYMPVLGRLRAGVTPAQARAEVRLFQSQVGALFPWKMPEEWNAAVSVVPLASGMVADVRARLLMLLGAVLLILLIACANVANLTLSRAAAREKEMAIRSALGAVRGRVARQLLTESVLLAAFGGVLGLFLATAGLSLLKLALPANTPRLPGVHVDWRVLVFTGMLTILTGIVFGLAPALKSTRLGLVATLNAAGRGDTVSVSERLRSSLAIAEVALAVLLVIAAGLLIRSFWAISHLNPGFQARHVVTARITPNQTFCSDPARCLSFYRDLLGQVQAYPGVSGAALVNTLPLGGRVAKRSVEVENFAPSRNNAPLFWLDAVTPDYFRVMGIPLAAGRGFSDVDSADNAAVTVVTASTARKFWEDGNPIGQHVRFVGEKDWRPVVGVISDVRAYDLQRNLPDFMQGVLYVPYNARATQENGYVPAEMTIAVRIDADDLQVADMLRRIAGGLNHDVPVTEVRSMSEVVSEAASTPASVTILFVTFAALALTLGIVGVYGVVSFLVSKRIREMGIRLALGAQRGDVLLLVLKEGAKVSFVGIALGMAGAFATSRLLSSELYGVSALDAIAYISVTALMTLATLLACYVPARRAANVDPISTLRDA